MSQRGKLWLGIVCVLLLTVVAGLFDVPQISGEGAFAKFVNSLDYRLGLDLKGGAHLVYQADVSKVPDVDRESAVGGVRDVIERRVNAFGVSEPVVQTAKSGDSYKVIVELAGVFDVNQAINQIGQTPLLEFKEQNPEANKPATPEEQKKLDQQNAAQKTKAEKLLKDVLKNPASFQEVAKANSDDPGSKANGGDLGFAKKGTFVPEFEKALFEDLKSGELTKSLVESQFGWHIIQKVSERGEGDAKEVESRHILIAKKTLNDVRPQASEWKETGLSGKQLKRASVQFDPNTGEPNVNLEFNDEGKDLFGEITKRNIGKPVAIFLDGEPISVPTVQQEITGGNAVITGRFSVKEAKQLVERLNAGALPVPITLVSQETVGPSMGIASLKKSLFAGLIGFILVVVFMLGFYRLPGLLASIALIIYTILSLFVFQLFNITLTLAGIAGFILSIGMAVDANVLIFERLKEELKAGKTAELAVVESFRRAWTSIRDSNISSLITCLILIWFGTSVIRGFAVTLALGIIVSMFTAITVTRQFMRVSVRESWKNRRWTMRGL